MPRAFVLEGTAVSNPDQDWCILAKRIPKLGGSAKAEVYYPVDERWVTQEQIRVKWSFNGGRQDVFDDGLFYSDEVPWDIAPRIFSWQEGDPLVYDDPPGEFSKHDCQVNFIMDRVRDRIIGDSNEDGVFNSGDLVDIFQSNIYGQTNPHFASWEQGDWDHNYRFDSADLVVAFQAGTYAAASVPVPEPEFTPSVLAIAVGVLMFLIARWVKRVAV